MWRRQRFNFAVDDVQREVKVERKVDQKPRKGCGREESGARRMSRSDEKVVRHRGEEVN